MKIQMDWIIDEIGVYPIQYHPIIHWISWNRWLDGVHLFQETSHKIDDWMILPYFRKPPNMASLMIGVLWGRLGDTVEIDQLVDGWETSAMVSHPGGFFEKRDGHPLSLSVLVSPYCHHIVTILSPYYHHTYCTHIVTTQLPYCTHLRNPMVTWPTWPFLPWSHQISEKKRGLGTLRCGAFGDARGGQNCFSSRQLRPIFNACKRHL